MTAEGMGHALQKIHHLLKPKGRLIDMHPIGEPPPITVCIGEETHLVGWVREGSAYEKYILADEALKTAVANNLYHKRKEDTFAFTTYCDSLTDLQTYLANEWTDAYIEDLVAMQIESIMQSSITNKLIVLKEIIKITQLQLTE